MLNYEAQFETSAFLELLGEFEGHGVSLFQMARRVPNSLTLLGLDDRAVDRVLCHNGLRVGFYLPHANEYAQVCSPDRGFLERLASKAEMQDLVRVPPNA
jgi:hypothetical protein